MADPTAYTRAYGFEDFQTGAPTTPLPGLKVDVELDAASSSIASLVNAVKDVRRSDGALKNQIVTPDSLSAASRALIAGGAIVPRGAWATAASYAVRDLVSQEGASYVAVTAHTSGTFATDLADGKWMLIASPYSLSGAVYSEVLSGDGTTTSFSLSQSFTSIDQITVWVQDGSAGYHRMRTDGTSPQVTLSGAAQITFSSAPGSGTRNIFVESANQAAAASAAAAAASASQSAASAASIEGDVVASEAAAAAASGYADAAEVSATAASSSAGTAQEWAVKTDGPVSGSDYSAKYYAGQASAVLANALQAPENLADVADPAAALANIGGLATGGDGSALTGLTGDQIAYDNVASGLVATDAQAALDELAARGLLQVVTASYSTSATLTATIPDDNTTPLVSEGAELLSATITPVSDSSVVLIRATIPMVAVSTSNAAIAALFVGSTCVNIAYLYPGAGNNAGSMVMDHYFAPGSLDPVTISVRIGATSATIYVNRTAGATLGGASKSTLVIEEVAA